MPSSPNQLPWGPSSLTAALPSQHARLLQIHGHSDQLSASAQLLVERMSGQEALNALFAFDIDTLCTDAGFDPSILIGQELTLRLLCADGRYRAWHGMLAGCDALGGDGGLARHRLYLRPWLAALALRRDSHVWGAQTLPDILADLFADYAQAHYAIEARRDWKPYPTRVQYHESDLDFVLRLLAEEGLSFRFEHQQEEGEASGAGPSAMSGQGGSGPDGRPTPSRHKLVVFDAETELPTYPPGAIRFHRIDATESGDSIDRLQAARRSVPHIASVSSWDHARLHAPAAQARSALQLGQLPPLEQHLPFSAQRHADGDAAQRHAEHWLHHWEAQAKRWKGAGSVRDLAPGQHFRLSGHDRYGQEARSRQHGDGYGYGDHGEDDGGNGDLQLRACALWHQAANNLGAQIAQLLQRRRSRQVATATASRPSMPRPPSCPAPAPSPAPPRPCWPWSWAATTRPVATTAMPCIPSAIIACRCACTGSSMGRLPLPKGRRAMPPRRQPPRAAPAARPASGCAWPRPWPAPTGAPASCPAWAPRCC